MVPEEDRNPLRRETSGQPHLEQLHAAVLRVLRLPFDLLLQVQDLGLQVPADPLEVKSCGRPSRHQVFRFIENYLKVVPLLESGVPAPPQERQEESVSALGWAQFSNWSLLRWSQHVASGSPPGPYVVWSREE